MAFRRQRDKLVIAACFRGRDESVPGLVAAEIDADDDFGDFTLLEFAGEKKFRGVVRETPVYSTLGSYPLAEYQAVIVDSSFVFLAEVLHELR